jgi:hypothetical protein
VPAVCPPGITDPPPSDASAIELPRVYVLHHVHWCIADKHLVFLDLKRDKYLGLDRADTLAAASSLLVKQDEVGSSTIAIPRRPTTDVVNELVEAGLLTLDSAMGRRPRAISPPIPEDELALDSRSSASTRSYLQASRFVLAEVRALLKLRLSSMENIIEKASGRKRRHRAKASNSSLAQYPLLVQTFLRHRRLVPMPYSCLFDSLALLEFLAINGLFPSWVFGVRMNPFAAHCWLQEGRTVLNDTADAVRNYTPILSI